MNQAQMKKDKPVTFIEQPKESDWECEMFGGGPNGIVWNPIQDHVPNFFWRWMQYICFGNKWKKKK